MSPFSFFHLKWVLLPTHSEIWSAVLVFMFQQKGVDVESAHNVIWFLEPWKNKIKYFFLNRLFAVLVLFLQRGGKGRWEKRKFRTTCRKNYNVYKKPCGLKLNRLVQCLLCSDDFLYEIFLKGREIQIKRQDSNFK